MLYIDVGNTLRGGLRTGIQRVVRSLAHEIAVNAPSRTRLIAYDLASDRYFALADPKFIGSTETLDAIPQSDRDYLELGDLNPGDVFFEPDSTWTEPLDRGSLFRRLKDNGVVIVVLNHDVIPLILPQVCHPNTIVSFAGCIADQMQYADYMLTTSDAAVADLQATARRFLGREIATRIVRLGADLDSPARSDADGRSPTTFGAMFPELEGLRYLLSVGTIEPRKNHELLLEAFNRLEAPDAALVIVGREGWMSDSFLATLTSHREFGKRIFWYARIDDDALLVLYEHAFASVLASQYEGYGLPAVEGLRLGRATICSDAGALPEVTQGHAELFPSGDGEALFALLDRLYRDPSYHASLTQRANAFQPVSWRDAGQHLCSVLDEIASGTSHDFAAPVRQMVYLSVHPERLDLSLQSVRRNLPFIERVAVLTKASARPAIEAVARRHFPDAIVLTDEEVADAPLPADHQARNTWLRKQLYRQNCIEANFLAADEDYLALQPVEREDFQRGAVHSAYYFLDDMGTWLAGSPMPTSFDGGMRNAWRVLRQAGYPARAYASHMPQIVNKSLCNQVFDRFVNDTERAAYDEWSLYFNVASHLLPQNFAPRAYAVLGWPMRMGDWLPQIAPAAPLFENYYPQNYEAGGMFSDLDPLGDLATKAARYDQALARARRIEINGEDGKGAGVLALIVAPDALTLIANAKVIAGRQNVRRILLIKAGGADQAVHGKLEMFLKTDAAALVGGESVMLGNVCWIPLLPPEEPGAYRLSIFVTLDDGTRLKAHAALDVVASDGGHGAGLIFAEVPLGSELYRQCLALRETLLRKPLGLVISDEEHADDRARHHFCATESGDVVACVSLKPLDGKTLQLKQMAVVEDRRGSKVGARLLAFAEDWAERAGYRSIMLHARIGAEGFYGKFGYRIEGEPFEENTIPHIKMIKRLRSTR